MDATLEGIATRELTLTPNDHLAATRIELRSRWQRWRAASPTVDRILADRAEFDRLGVVLGVPDGVTTEAVNAYGTAGEWLRPPRARRDLVLLFLHAGGYVMGSVQLGHHSLVRWATATRAAGLNVGYRHAPEHPFPAALEDALAAYRWLLDGGRSPDEIVLLGESAGGGLAIALMVAARERGWPLPTTAVTVSAWTDLSFSTRSGRRRRADHSIDVDDLRVCASLYAGDTSLRDPFVSPMFADLHGLPPTLMLVGGGEALLPDTLLLAERARAAGTEVEVVLAPRMPHCFTTLADRLPAGRAGIEEVARWIADRCGQPST